MVSLIVNFELIDWTQIQRTCPLTFRIRNVYRIRKWDQINLIHPTGCKSAMTWELSAIKHLYATQYAPLQDDNC